MRTVDKLPRWALASLTALMAIVALRYVVALDSGVDHVTAIRTYLFWALVVAPVAVLADMVGRTIMNYRLVQLAVAKVQSNRS